LVGAKAPQRPAPDLVKREFTATGPNQLWVADMIHMPTWAGFISLASVLDVWGHVAHERARRTENDFSVGCFQLRGNPG
jgi:hypothetical protein